MKITQAGSAADIPSGQLATLVTALEELSGQKAPSTLAQKRTFLTNWYEDNKAGFASVPIPPATPHQRPSTPQRPPERSFERVRRLQVSLL